VQQQFRGQESELLLDDQLRLGPVDNSTHDLLHVAMLPSWGDAADRWSPNSGH
jgi:hypothetical protein